ncbi:MAG TPA: hypothetical protein VFB62_14280 [Polyangiaceae bacterium]|nr:hypothetical protein [Polyangiaceae bacterium]
MRCRRLIFAVLALVGCEQALGLDDFGPRLPSSTAEGPSTTATGNGPVTSTASGGGIGGFGGAVGGASSMSSSASSTSSTGGGGSGGHGNGGLPGVGGN